MDYNYCPDCDNVVYEEKGQCMKCKARIVKFSDRTESLMWTILILVFIAVISLIFAIGSLPNWGSFIGGIMIFSISFYLAMSFGRKLNKQVVAKARDIFGKNKERYVSGEKLDFRVKISKKNKPPWSIRHIHFISRSMILFSGLIPITVAVIWYVRTVTFCASIVLMSLIITTVFLYLAYKPASRFVGVIVAFDLFPGEYQFKRWGAMHVHSSMHGRFSLYYDASYRLAISTQKQLVSKGDRNPTIWKRPSLLQRILGREGRLPDYLSHAWLREIKSLESIGFERRKRGARIVAKLREKRFYSETRDIQKTLEMLREIERWV